MYSRSQYMLKMELEDPMLKMLFVLSTDNKLVVLRMLSPDTVESKDAKASVDKRDRVESALKTLLQERKEYQLCDPRLLSSQRSTHVFFGTEAV